MYKRFIANDTSANTGWDRFAADYVSHGSNPVFQLMKDRIMEHLHQQLEMDKITSILDFNCGTGNDLATFLAMGKEVTACDGSASMLRIAHERYPNVSLYHGMNQDLRPDSFDGKRFDLIYSVVGGFTYVEPREMLRELKCLASMLNEGGHIALTQFNRHCAADTIYNLVRMRWDAATFRYARTKQVVIKGEAYPMHLITDKEFRRLVSGHLEIESHAPILSAIPPYQSGYKAGRSIGLLEKLDRSVSDSLIGPLIADQNLYILKAT